MGTYLGDNALGVVIAATLGLLINVPLLFEIPLVAALLLVGMGTAPAAVLLFAAAAGGPVTFWGLARVMPKRVVATFATATWGLAAVGGLAILALGPLIGGGEPIFSDVSERAGAGFHLDRDYRDIVLKDDVGLRSGVLDFDPLLGAALLSLTMMAMETRTFTLPPQRAWTLSRRHPAGTTPSSATTATAPSPTSPRHRESATCPASAQVDALPTTTTTATRTCS